MMVEQPPTKLHPQGGSRWLVRSLLTFGGVLVLCPLFALSAIIFVNQCDIETSWYRFHQRVPLVPVPPTAQLMTARRSDGTPNYGSAIVAAWYYERFLTDMSAPSVAAFYQQRGDTCRQIDGDYHMGGFTLDLQKPYWQCQVATEPWGSGDVDILPQEAYAAALRTVYEHPPSHLTVSISETVIGGSLQQIYRGKPFSSSTVPLSETVILTEVRWCEP